jgi:hypothetical protein
MTMTSSRKFLVGQTVSYQSRGRRRVARGKFQITRTLALGDGEIIHLLKNLDDGRELVASERELCLVRRAS